MTDRELKRMSRRELLELLVASEKENERLREALEQQKVELQNRNLQIEEAGNLADAVVSLNGVFESADRAATQYLDNVRRYSLQQKIIGERIVSEAEEKANKILDEAEKVRREKNTEADAYWEEISSRLEAFYEEHIGLREILSVVSRRSAGENE